jgi:hypothetical protein
MGCVGCTVEHVVRELQTAVETGFCRDRAVIAILIAHRPTVALPERCDLYRAAKFTLLVMAFCQKQNLRTRI